MAEAAYMVYSSGPVVTDYLRYAGQVRQHSEQLLQRASGFAMPFDALLVDVVELRPRTVAGQEHVQLKVLTRESRFGRSALLPMSEAMACACYRLLENASDIVVRWLAATASWSSSKDLVCSGLRIIRYPTVPVRSSLTVDGSFLPEHVDEAAVSLVSPGGGLEIWDGTWRRASSGALHVLVGDRLPSSRPTLHRVQPTGSDCPMISLVVFFDRPEDLAEIQRASY